MAIALNLPPGTANPADVIYPESDGEPISDHTLQFEWIVTIKGNLDALFADNPNVFVAGDLLWYPVKGNPKVRLAPDAMVVFGRPKGERGSYQQFNEDNVPPQVVFEVLSPGNRYGEMLSKFVFYQKYGVEEYYLYDPFRQDFTAWVRQADGFELELVENGNDCLSPRLGIRFVLEENKPLDGTKFLTFTELAQFAHDSERRAEAAERRAEQFAAKLRALGIDPETV